MSGVPKLPGSPKNGDQALDTYGNIWEYDSVTGVWIDRGTLSTTSNVTEQISGLVTPDIFKKLAYLRQLYSADADSFTPFKILPGTAAYWYYLHSSNKLFRFIPEGPNRLRIEVDRGRLYQILLKQSCPGPKGPQGPQGDRGLTGTSGALEVCFIPTAIADDRMDFAIFTPTPINTPISIRLYGAPPVSLSPTIQSLSSAKSNQLRYWEQYLKQNGFTNPYGVVETQLKHVKAKYQATTMLKQVVTSCNIALSARSDPPDPKGRLVTRLSAP
jgi:hypothetical protein